MNSQERAICDFILQFLERERWPPTTREIAEGMGFGSASTVIYHLNPMEVAGLIERGKNSASRAIRVTDKALAEVRPGAPGILLPVKAR